MTSERHRGHWYVPVRPGRPSEAVRGADSDSASRLRVGASWQRRGTGAATASSWVGAAFAPPGPARSPAMRVVPTHPRIARPTGRSGSGGDRQARGRRVGRPARDDGVACRGALHWARRNAFNRGAPWRPQSTQRGHGIGPWIGLVSGRDHRRASGGSGQVMGRPACPLWDIAWAGAGRAYLVRRTAFYRGTRWRITTERPGDGIVAGPASGNAFSRGRDTPTAKGRHTVSPPPGAANIVTSSCPPRLSPPLVGKAPPPEPGRRPRGCLAIGPCTWSAKAMP